mgnify:CR=1 FL=1
MSNKGVAFVRFFKSESVLKAIDAEEITLDFTLLEIMVSDERPRREREFETNADFESLRRGGGAGGPPRFGGGGGFQRRQ